MNDILTETADKLMDYCSASSPFDENGSDQLRSMIVLLDAPFSSDQAPLVTALETAFKNAGSYATTCDLRIEKRQPIFPGVFILTGLDWLGADETLSVLKKCHDLVAKKPTGRLIVAIADRDVVRSAVAKAQGGVGEAILRALVRLEMVAPSVPVPLDKAFSAAFLSSIPPDSVETQLLSAMSQTMQETSFKRMALSLEVELTEMRRAGLWQNFSQDENEGWALYRQTGILLSWLKHGPSTRHDGGLSIFGNVFQSFVDGTTLYDAFWVMDEVKSHLGGFLSESASKRVMGLALSCGLKPFEIAAAKSDSDDLDEIFKEVNDDLNYHSSEPSVGAMIDAWSEVTDILKGFDSDPLRSRPPGPLGPKVPARSIGECLRHVLSPVMPPPTVA